MESPGLLQKFTGFAERKGFLGTSTEYTSAPQVERSTSPANGNGHRESKQYGAIPQGWPTHPYRLGAFRIFYLVLGTILSILPLLFLVLAALAVSLDGKKVSRFGDGVIEAVRISPTLFPIIFSILAVRALKFIAIWKAGKGTQLGTLEKLTGSTSIGSTIRLLIRLRDVSIAGVLILLFWLLSPIAGQASLRMIEVSDSVSATQDTNIWYLNADQASKLNTESPQVNALLKINTLFSSAVISSEEQRNSPVDMFGNVKIPLLEGWTPMGEQSDAWIKLFDEDNISIRNFTEYTSLLGVPIVGLPKEPEAVTNFTMESSYMVLDCTPPQAPQANITDRELLALPANTYDRNPDGSVKTNEITMKTWIENFYKVNEGEGQNIILNSPTMLEFGKLFTDVNRDPRPARELVFVYFVAGDANNDPGYAAVRCGVTTAYTETRVTCNGPNCRALAVRPSQLPHLHPNISRLEDWEGLNFFKEFPAATRTAKGQSTPIERFVNDTNAAFNTLPERIELHHLPVREFNRRFSTLLNTYWQAAIAPEFINRIPDVDLKLDPPASVPQHIYPDPQLNGIRNEARNPNAPFFSRSVSTKTEFFAKHYEVHYGWVGVLIAVSALLMILSFIATILKFISPAPDALNSVVCNTFDNPYVQIPEGGSAFDGLDRARHLKKMTVRLSDVRPGDDVGHVAFTGSMAGPEGLVGSRLDRRKLYL